jgi:hypothetical protein
MAKVAEINGYPGPAPVLDLATQLGLTPDQLQQVTAIFERISAAALKPQKAAGTAFSDCVLGKYG